MSISSSSTSGRILSSDLLGTVALWETRQVAPERGQVIIVKDDDDDDDDDEEQEALARSPWKLELLASKSVKGFRFNVDNEENGGEAIKQKTPSKLWKAALHLGCCLILHYFQPAT
jgi:hypothetical protein